MIRICNRCGELTGDKYCITIYPASTNGIVEHYFVCNDCVDKIRAFIKTDDPNPYEVRELTMDEWRAWKNNPKRKPICELWEHDTSPMWVLNPDTIHEPALLMGKLKLFTGKPTLEQCKAVKWDD